MKLDSSFRDLFIASGLYVTSSIIGPLLLFGGVGMVLDSIFGTDPWLLLGGVGIAFIISNTLLFRRIAQLSKDIEQATQHEKKEK